MIDGSIHARRIEGLVLRVRDDTCEAVSMQVCVLYIGCRTLQHSLDRSKFILADRSRLRIRSRSTTVYVVAVVYVYAYVNLRMRTPRVSTCTSLTPGQCTCKFLPLQLATWKARGSRLRSPAAYCSSRPVGSRIWISMRCGSNCNCKCRDTSRRLAHSRRPGPARR